MEIGKQQVRSAFEFDAIMSARTENMWERKRRCLGVNRKALEQQAKNSFPLERQKQASCAQSEKPRRCTREITNCGWYAKDAIKMRLKWMKSETESYGVASAGGGGEDVDPERMGFKSEKLTRTH